MKKHHHFHLMGELNFLTLSLFSIFFERETVVLVGLFNKLLKMESLKGGKLMLELGDCSYY
jgi:hypothetical protein